MKLPRIKLPRLRLPRIDIHHWPTTTFSLFTIFGFIIGCIMLHSSYFHYLKGDFIKMGYGIAMGFMIMFVYGFNDRFINRLADRRLELWKDTHIFEDSVNIVKMEIEIAMRRDGHDVPKELLATLPHIDDIKEQGLFYKALDFANAGRRNNN